MNRRDLIRRSSLALLGAGAVVMGVKASTVRELEEDKTYLVSSKTRVHEPQELHIYFHPEPGKSFRDVVVKPVTQASEARLR